MRTLEEIRNSKKNDDLLFVGMKSSSVKLPEDEFYNEVMKPMSRRVFERMIKCESIS
jgi:hypothetical protein